MGEHVQMQEVPQFWILAQDREGMLADSRGYWTKRDQHQEALELLDDGWSVTFSTAGLQSPERIATVIRYWSDMRKDAEDNLRDHAEANPTGCPVGCEQCANLLREYDATLTPSERAEGELKTTRAMKGLAK